MTLIGRVISPR